MPACNLHHGASAPLRHESPTLRAKAICVIYADRRVRPPLARLDRAGFVAPLALSGLLRETHGAKAPSSQKSLDLSRLFRIPNGSQRPVRGAALRAQTQSVPSLQHGSVLVSEPNRVGLCATKAYLRRGEPASSTVMRAETEAVTKGLGAAAVCAMRPSSSSAPTPCRCSADWILSSRVAQHRPPDNLALLPWPCGHITEEGPTSWPAAHLPPTISLDPRDIKSAETTCTSEGRGEGTELRDAADEDHHWSEAGPQTGWWRQLMCQLATGTVKPSSCVAHGWSGDCDRLIGPRHRKPPDLQCRVQWSKEA